MLKLLLFTVLISSASYSSEVEVEFEELENQKGSIKYLIFNDEKGYPDQVNRSYLRGEFPASQSELMLDLPDGDYSMTVIHDEDGNGKLNKNFVGLPKEGFGFSNNPRIYFGPPSYEKTRFTVQGPRSLKIKMKYL